MLSVTGCGIGTTAPSDVVPLTVSGRVHGGQQAVVGAQIQLYVAGSAGNGSASSPLLNNAVTSGQDGSFSITGDYSCPSANSQVYLVATQGNPGLGSGGNNPALAMMAALGSCGNLSPSQFIWINEVTTAAAAWALAPFTTDIAHIGASSTNSVGLANAFLNAQLIANTTNGTVATLPSGEVTETAKIYALADAMASCINSDGSTGCQPFFTAATPGGGTAPTNTWDATINVVKNPGNNVSGVFGAIGPQPPFATTLAAAPNDWTLSLTITDGGISSPEGLAVDSQGNVWLLDHSGILSAFNPQGTPLSASGFGQPIAVEAYGVAIDPNDNPWITLAENPIHNPTRGSLERFWGVSSGQTLGGTTDFSDNTVNYPYAIAADSNGNIFAANYYVNASSTNLEMLNPSTSTFTAVATGSAVGFPVALAVDTNHGVWITGTDGPSVSHFDSGGNLVFSTDCCGPVSSVALDSTGNVWLADRENSDIDGTGTNGAVTEFAPDGTILQAFITSGGITNPSSVAVDAAQNVWVSNLHTTGPQGTTESFSEIAGSNSASPGTALSPSTGYGLDAQLDLPYALAVDASGNIWVSNTGGNNDVGSLVMFFGMAAPTKTPHPVTPQAP
jgi:sugar lactone lactonase YvrE